MALLAINLSDNLFRQIRTLVDEGKYSTPESFLEIAAFNQLALERGSSPTEILSQGHRVTALVASEPKASLSRDTADAPARTAKAASTGTPMRIPKQVYVVESRNTSIEVVLRPFQLHATGAEQHPPAATEQICTNRVFGQVNRLFPLKLICRWLYANVLDTNAETWPLYSSVADSLGDHAAQLGSLLEGWDQISGRKRDEQFATGLPRRGNSASRDRFLSQFIARITRATELIPGAIYQYQLANFVEGRIELTASGIDFAKLPNSMLDQAPTPQASTLSDHDVKFLGKHVRTWALGEARDMRSVLRAVHNGIIAPSHVVAEVLSDFPSEWGETVVTTHVGGVIARLCDLRLIKRYWHGRNVEYRIAAKNDVQEFLESEHEGK